MQFTTSVFRFQNLPLSEDEIEEILSSPAVLEQQVEALLDGNNPQGAIQYTKIVSGLMNERLNNNQQRNNRIQVCYKQNFKEGVSG